MPVSAGPLIRFLRPGEEETAMQLVHDTFMEWVAPRFGAEGIAEFLSFATAPALAARLAQGHFCIVAEQDGTLDGLVEVRDASHICLLFVRTRAQRQGLAKRLLAAATARCRELDSAVTEFTVNASPNSRETYLHLGFVPAGPERTVNGITFTPMRLVPAPPRPLTPPPGDPAPDSLRIGQISYLNVLALFHHLKALFPPSERVEYVQGHPSEMNAMLARGELDVSPASAFEYLRGAENYRLLPDLSITASSGPVKSVLLVSPVGLADLPGWMAEHGGAVGVTGASASSVALLKVLWKYCWGLPEARWEAIEPGTGLTGARPFLEIGNHALRLWVDPPEGRHVIDLAEAWQRWQGLPFVFAVWIVRRGLSPAQKETLADVYTALKHCKTTCVAAIAEIAQWDEFTSWINRAGIEDYLSTVDYDLGPAEQASLAVFADYCTRLGLLSGAPALTWAV